MLSIRGRNVNDIFPLGLFHLKNSGVERSSRNGPTLEIMSPVAVQYDRPEERVLFSAERDANPIFHLFEALWMLSGRDDVEFLHEYNSQMRQYSDDGERFNAAYGHRLRAHFQRDQIDEVITLLRRNPDDRQAVLQIWDVEDLGKPTKDKACLAGETIIPSPEGNRTISELSELFSSGEITKWPVYAVDMNTGEQCVSWCDSIWSNGIKRTVKLTFDNGTSLSLTKDHVLYKKKYLHEGRVRVGVERKECTAGDLKIGDRIEATSLEFKNNSGHRWYKKNLFTNTTFSNQAHIHRKYYELCFGELPKDHDVHHVNEDKLDNRLSNLELLTHSIHSSEHRIGDKNPMRNMSKEQHAVRSKKWKETVSDRHGWQVSDVVNHKIVKIEEDVEQEVFDFHVPIYHNALIADGIVAHNCNLTIVPRIRDGYLDWTVYNRSNDFILGALGANAVHMSVIQEFVARMVGVKVGRYWQVSNCMHVYTELTPHWQKCNNLPLSVDDPYKNGTVEPFPLITNKESWMCDLYTFMEQPWRGVRYVDPFFNKVARPMAVAHRAHKEGKNGLDYVSQIEASDWQLACKQWLMKREQK